jgi:FdhE protein
VINTEAKNIRRTIDVIKKDRPEYKQVLDLFGKLMIKQAEFSDKVKVEPVSIKKEAARERLEEGMPLLRRRDFQIDLANASKLFREVYSILKRGNPDLSDEMRTIEDALEKGDLVLEDILQSTLTDERRVSELAEELSLDKEVILILTTISVKPSLESIASQVRDMVGEISWTERYCPVCGSSPAISELRSRGGVNPLPSGGVDGGAAEGAERILHCSFCGNEWRTARLGCVFCGNSDSKSLNYLYTEEEKGYRIDVCEKCKKYIKTLDSRAISHEIVLPVEDFSTMHLDILAEEEGYKREAWLMPYGAQVSPVS